MSVSVFKDAAFGSLADERVILGFEQSDHRTRRLANDLADQLQGMRAAVAQSHQGHIGMLAPSHRRNLIHLDRPCDHLVAEADHDAGDIVEPVASLICDQDTKMLMFMKLIHRHHLPAAP